MQVIRLRKRQKRKKKVVKQYPSKSQMVGCKSIGNAGIAKDTYKLYLETGHWKMLRRRKLSLNPICEACKEKPATQVHHKRYTRNGESILYRENLKEDLKSLCKECHKLEHNIL